MAEVQQFAPILLGPSARCPEPGLAWLTLRCHTVSNSSQGSGQPSSSLYIFAVGDGRGEGLVELNIGAAIQSVVVANDQERDISGQVKGDSFSDQIPRMGVVVYRLKLGQRGAT